MSAPITHVPDLDLPFNRRPEAILRFIAELGCEPLYGNPYAAGIDLRAAIGGRIEARALATFHTGLKVEIPPGHVGLVRGRSGLAFKSCIWAYDGTIDEDYRGEILVLLENKSIVPHIVQRSWSSCRLPARRWCRCRSSKHTMGEAPTASAARGPGDGPGDRVPARNGPPRVLHRRDRCPARGDRCARPEGLVRAPRGQVRRRAEDVLPADGCWAEDRSEPLTQGTHWHEQRHLRALNSETTDSPTPAPRPSKTSDRAGQVPTPKEATWN